MNEKERRGELPAEKDLRRGFENLDKALHPFRPRFLRRFDPRMKEGQISLKKLRRKGKKPGHVIRN